MAAAAFLPSSLRLPQRRSPANPRTNHTSTITKRAHPINAKQGENDSDLGKSVDENMIMLKMRIKKMKVLESNNETGAAAPPSDWNEWEKKVFTRYHEGVCDLTEMLQAYLMNTRPSVALGVLALVSMSVPLSSSVVMANAIKLVRGLLAGTHICIDIDF